MRVATLVLIAATAATAAAEPIPADKAALVGEWEGHGVTLSISAGGQIAYKRQISGGMSKSVSGFFKGFEGNKMKVNVLVTTFDLVIDVPPHVDRGVWLMTIEGAEVLRKSTAPAGELSLKDRAEDALRRDYTGKGVAVRSVRCPSTNERAFKCELTTALGDTVPVQCVIDKKGDLLFKADAAFLDPKALVGLIEKLHLDKIKLTPTVTCPAGAIIVKNVGDVFTCAVKDSKRTYQARVTVKDAAGNVSIDY